MVTVATATEVPVVVVVLANAVGVVGVTRQEQAFEMTELAKAFKTSN